MAVVQTIGFTSTLFTDENKYYEQSGRWGSISASTATPVADLASPFQGYLLNWGGFDEQTTNSPEFSKPYIAYNTNWAGYDMQSVTQATFVNQPYTGYNTNWGAYREKEDDQPSALDVDIDSVVDHPKDQIIYYKLKGWNPNTLAYEVWTISHNITGRTTLDGALFDPNPGRSPANVERDLFKTPPSGNTLENIVIVARWFE